MKDEPDDVPRARSIAKFLKSATRLDKRLLGDFISRSENTEILKEFISLYDFKSVRNYFRDVGSELLTFINTEIYR